MRIFVIADSLRRKKRPYGILRYDEERDEFQIEISQRVQASQVPLSLGMYAQNGKYILDEDESLDWARSRVVPEDRQNINAILAEKGMAEYRVIDLLAQSQGFSSDDDMQLYELDGGLCAGLDCDQIIDSVRRQAFEGEISYAIVSLEDRSSSEYRPSPACQPLPAHPRQNDLAHSIGRAIRDARHQEGLTQKELAARAGIRQSVLSGVEKGEGNPTIGLLQDISSALGRELVLSLDEPKNEPKTIRSNE